MLAFFLYATGDSESAAVLPVASDFSEDRTKTTHTAATIYGKSWFRVLDRLQRECRLDMIKIRTLLESTLHVFMSAETCMQMVSHKMVLQITVPTY